MITIFNPLKNNKYIFQRAVFLTILLQQYFYFVTFALFNQHFFAFSPLVYPSLYYLLNTTVKQLLTSAFSQLIGSSRHACKLFFRAVAQDKEPEISLATKSIMSGYKDKMNSQKHPSCIILPDQLHNYTQQLEILETAMIYSTHCSHS